MQTAEAKLNEADHIQDKTEEAYKVSSIVSEGRMWVEVGVGGGYPPRFARVLHAARSFDHASPKARFFDP